MKVTDLLVEDGYETYAIGKMHFMPVSTEGSFESLPNIADESFWKQFDNPDLLGMQDRHIEEEGPVQKRTSFSWES